MEVKPVFMVLECPTVYHINQRRHIRYQLFCSRLPRLHGLLWASKTGDNDLEVTAEEKNEHDKFALAI